MKAAASKPAVKRTAAKGTGSKGRTAMPKDGHETAPDTGPGEMSEFPRASVEDRPILRRRCACGGGCPKCSSKERIQTRLRIGSVGDPFEREADRMAEQVMRLPVGLNRPAAIAGPASGSGGTVRRLAAPPSAAPAAAPALVSAPVSSTAPSPAQGGARTRAVKGGSATPVAPAPVEEATEEEVPASPVSPFTFASLGEEDLTRGGSPLPGSLRRFFEARFGRDLSAVRLHMGAASEAFNDQLHAHAFTFGWHVWLGRDHAPAADFLLAHELAHVIQQRQPNPLPAGGGRAAGGAAADRHQGGEAIVRRLDLGGAFPFWSPLGAAGRMTGEELHEYLLGLAQKENKSLDIEQPAPVANSKDWGLDYHGRIDLYYGLRGTRPHARPGLTFEGVTGTKYPPVPDVYKPVKHRFALKRGIEAGEYNPHVDLTDGSIQGINKAPTRIEVGELKPASLAMIERGKKQVGNYIDGLKYAKELTNKWLALRGRTETWNLQDPIPMQKSRVKFKEGSVNLDYASGKKNKADTKLVLTTVKERATIGNKYAVRPVFDPEEYKLNPIMGGIYTLHAGDGVWVYFARPANLKEVLENARRSRNYRAEIELANQVQQDVIDKLMAPPRKAAKAVAKLEKEGPPPATAAPPEVRRRKKGGKPPPKMEKNFDLAAWEKGHQALHDKVHGVADPKSRLQAAGLRLLEEAYEAENTWKDSKLGKSLLPSKSTDTVKVKTTGAKTKDLRKDLGSIGKWIYGWTGKPARILGKLRDRFGGLFVTVVEKAITLKDKIKAKFDSIFHPKVKAKSGKARMVLRAIAKAAVQVGRLFISYVLHLIADSIEAGSRKLLEEQFGIKPETLLGDDFEKEIEKRFEPIAEFEKKAEEHIQQTVDEFTKDLAWIKELEDLASVVGPIAEAAAIAVQCGTPPGWGCLKILLRPLHNCIIELALESCDVQEEIAEHVAKVGPIADIPRRIGQKALDLMREAAPDLLKTAFSVPIPKSTLPGAGEAECVASPIESTCPPGIFSLFDMPPRPGDEDGKGESAEQPPPPPPPPPPPKEKRKIDLPPDSGPEDEKKDDPGTKSLPGGRGEKTPPKPDEPELKKAPPGGPEDKPGPTTGPGEMEPKPTPPGSKPEGNQPGGTVKPEGPVEGAPPQPPGGKPDQGNAPSTRPKDEAGGPQAGASRPSVTELKFTEAHKALADLQRDFGPERMGALHDLARSLGMPDDVPITPKQIKKLRELLEKAGNPSAQDIQDFAAGKTDKDLARKLKPLRDYLYGQARQGALKDIAKGLREKRFEYKFNEMARDKVHWKLLIPYRPGPFLNAGALMWDKDLEAAGVVDGEFGPCTDGGKFSLLITRAEMYTKDGKRILVSVPFRDKDAQLKGGVCPAEGGSAGGEAESGKKPQQEEKQPPQPKGGGKAEGEGEPGASEGKAKPEAPAGEAEEDGKEAESRQKPKWRRDPNDLPKVKAPVEGGQEVITLDPEDEAAGGGKVGAGGRFFEYCAGNALNCKVNGWGVIFEEAGSARNAGWVVEPMHGDIYDKPFRSERDAGPGRGSERTGSILNPPNPRAILSISTARTDGTYDVHYTEDGAKVLVGKARKSPVISGHYEMVSGKALESLQAALRNWHAANRNGKPLTSQRIHFR